MNGNYKHGMWNTKFYRTWYNMNGRCYRNTSRNASYKDKGIVVLRKTFQEFKNDMYDSYLEHSLAHGENNTTIDRIDNDGNYCKENCRWATYRVQSINNSRTHFLNDGLQRKSTKERSEELGINENTMRVRILRGKDPLHIGKIPRSTTVMPYYNKHKEIFGDEARTYHCIYRRIRIDGWDIEKAINTL